MCCRYFIPEDGDEERYPNIFKIDETNKAATTLEKIKKQFPLQGVFVFRFLRNLNGTMVWLDAGSGGYDDSQVTIPVDLTDGLLMKVTRVQNSSSGVDGQNFAINTSSSMKSSASSNSNSVQSPFGLTSLESSAAQKDCGNETAKPNKPAARRGSEQLMKFEEETPNPLNAKAGDAGNSADLFGFDPFAGGEFNASDAPSSNTDSIFRDFDNLTPPPVATSTTPTVDPFASTGSGATVNAGMKGNNNSNSNGGLSGLSGLNMNPMQGGMGGGNVMGNPMGGGMGGGMNAMNGGMGGNNMNRNTSGGRNGNGNGDAFSSLGGLGSNNGNRKW